MGHMFFFRRSKEEGEEKGKTKRRMGCKEKMVAQTKVVFAGLGFCPHWTFFFFFVFSP